MDGGWGVEVGVGGWGVGGVGEGKMEKKKKQEIMQQRNEKW